MSRQAVTDVFHIGSISFGEFLLTGRGASDVVSRTVPLTTSTQEAQDTVTLHQETAEFLELCLGTSSVPMRALEKDKEGDGTWSAMTPLGRRSTRLGDSPMASESSPDAGNTKVQIFSLRMPQMLARIRSRMSDQGEATQILQRLQAGDGEAASELLPLIYRQLRVLADRYMQDERAGHTLQPTALVHEAYARLVDAENAAPWESRAHFVRVAARAMRNVLVDHARAKRALKRGKGARPVALDQVMAAFEERSLDVLSLHDALEKLAGVDPELARLVELRFFVGLTIADTARVLGVSTPTVERSWRVARMWLKKELAD